MEFDLAKPGEKRKLIIASILGLIAIVFLWWTFFGFGSNATPSRPSAQQQQQQQQQQQPGRRPGAPQAQPTPPLSDLVATLMEVKLPEDVPLVPEPRRNIFAFYEPPVVAQTVATPTPTPTPTPPVLLASVSPGNVYARTADFTLEVAGDKFTPELKIMVDGRELPTKYSSPQQLSAIVPAAMISNAGAKQITVRSSDGRLYSGNVQLNVAPPPTPNYTYVGIISKPARVDIALLQEVGSKTIMSVQRGDVLSGRFRVTSIADKEIVMTDTNLKIKHTLAMTEGDKGFSSPLSRPTPRVDAEDDEPQL